MRLIDADALAASLGITNMDCQKCDWHGSLGCKRGSDFVAACEAIEDAPTIDTDLSAYSDKLWKMAYERGKAEAVRWIPVSERLPDKSGKYLVSVTNGNVYAGTFDAYSGCFQCAAVAWQPLPESYKDGDVK